LKHSKNNTEVHIESEDRIQLDIIRKRDEDDDELVMRLNCDMPFSEGGSSLTELSIIDNGNGLGETDITNDTMEPGVSIISGNQRTSFGSIIQLFVEKTSRFSGQK